MLQRLKTSGVTAALALAIAALVAAPPALAMFMANGTIVAQPNLNFTFTNPSAKRTITVPDPGANSAKVLMTTGTATTLTSTSAAMQQVFTSFGSVSFDRSVKVARVALAAVRTGGGVFAWANPETGSILITRVLLDVTTQSTGASTIDVGTTATSATTSSDNFIDGASGATAAVLGNLGNAGTNGKTVQKLATGKWVTASEASGDVTGLAGFAYVYYINI